jgi:hypothetical protein
MRLLEFNKDDGGANPRRPGSGKQPGKTARSSVQPLPSPRQLNTPNKATPASRRPFPVNGNTLPKAAGPAPIDIEHLQERIVILERRLAEVSSRSDRKASVEELQQLQQRMRALETSLDNEIWQAKQREHTMLEMLAKPSLKQRIRQRFNRLLATDLPALGRMLKRLLHSWWQDSQPGWWPSLARNWRESLDKARR